MPSNYLRNTLLGRSDFSRATVLNCDFTNADLSTSNWKRVENCIWKHVKIGDQENFPKYMLEEIQIQNAKSEKKRKPEIRTESMSRQATVSSAARVNALWELQSAIGEELSTLMTNILNKTFPGEL